MPLVSWTCQVSHLLFFSFHFSSLLWPPFDLHIISPNNSCFPNYLFEIISCIQNPHFTFRFGNLWFLPFIDFDFRPHEQTLNFGVQWMQVVRIGRIMSTRQCRRLDLECFIDLLELYSNGCGFANTFLENLLFFGFIYVGGILFNWLNFFCFCLSWHDLEPRSCLCIMYLFDITRFVYDDTICYTIEFCINYNRFENSGDDTIQEWHDIGLTRYVIDRHDTI